MTEAEWRAAKHGGANCALFVKEGSELTSRAKAFIASERDACIYVPYLDLNSLQRAVQSALTQAMTDAIRHRALARRAREIGQSPAMHLLEAGIERAERLYGSGAIKQAREVLDAIDALLGAGDEVPEDFELVSGLVAGAGGHASKAAAAYIRIIRSPRSSKHAKAIAFQNLGNEAMRAGQLRDAKSYMRSSLKRHRAADDWFGVLQVLLNMGNLALDRGDADTAAELAAVAEQLVPCFRPPVPHQRASVIGLQARIAAHLGRHEEALAKFKAAHAAFKRLGDIEGQIVGCQNIAMAYHDLGRPRLASRWAAKALAFAEDQGPTWRREEVHRLAALIQLALGRRPEARHHFEQARALAKQMGDAWRVATLTADIGAVLAELDSDEALAELERARRLLEEQGDFDWLVRVGMNRALLAARGGDTAAAVGMLEELTGASQASRSLRTSVFERLGSLQLDAGQGAEAARNFKQAVALQPKTPQAAIAAGRYAHGLQEAGEHKGALQLFDLAVRRGDAGDDAGVIFDTRSDRALLLAAMGRETEALSELESCLDTARRLCNAERTVRALHNIGELARRVGDERRSLKVLREACSIAERSGDGEAHRSAMGLLAMAQLALGRVPDAERTASTLRGWAQSSHDRGNESAALGVLGGCAFATSDYWRAADLYRAASRRNVDDPVHHAEDLCGIVESHAAAGRWRPTIRAAQALATHAQGHGCEALAWKSLTRAARRYMDRGQQRQAGTLTAPAWMLALQAESRRPQDSKRGNRDLEGSELMDAMLTTAFHELWSGWPACGDLYEEIVHQLDLEQEESGIRGLIDQARQVARQTDSRRA